MKTPVEIHRYSIPVNEAAEGGSVTMAQLTFIDSRPRQRRVIMQRFLRHTFNVTRKMAQHMIERMGFDDLTNTGCKSSR